MGITGLLGHITENKEAVCTECHIKGELIIDGAALLHELYDLNELDWANGGRYAQLCQVTLDYFQPLKKHGVKPIVVFNGGSNAEVFKDTLQKRKEIITELPEMIEKRHLGRKGKIILPYMARTIFMSTLRKNDINVYVADGKAMKSIVYLAYCYHCPILVGNTNYCACNIEGGVIFFRHLDVETGKAYVYKQTKLVKFFGLCNPDLLYAVWAIMGDGSKFVPNIYYGRIRDQITNSIDFNNKRYFLNVICFLQKKTFASFYELQYSHWAVENFGGQYKNFLENCQNVEEVYIRKFHPECNGLSIEQFCESTTFRLSKPGNMPPPILRGYCNGTFPKIAINAILLGEFILEQCVGDPGQPPIPTLSLPVRELIYGLVSDLMNYNGIQEHYPSNDGTLVYKVQEVTPTCKYKELMVTKLYCKGDKTKRALAVQAVCEVLHCPETVVHALEGSEADKSLILVTIVTRCWAEYLIQSQQLPKPHQLIKALVVNFFLNLSAPGANRDPEIDESLFSHPHWIKVHHALLMWKSLYRSIHWLNTMLCEPLQPQSPYTLFDGPLIIFLALYESSQIVDTYQNMLTPEEKKQYSKLFELIVIK